MISHSEIVSRLDAKANGTGHRAKCPAHEDSSPSLSIGVGDDGRILFNCFAGCTPDAICAAINIKVADLYPEKQSRTKRAAITVADLAARLRHDATYLRSFGVRDLTDGGVLIPYRDAQGNEVAIKKRTALVAKEGSFWPKGKPLLAYGLDRLAAARAAGYLVLVEGESDCWALSHHDIPALGIPGASVVEKTLHAEHLEGIGQIYAVHEPDEGGDKFVKGLKQRLAALRFKGTAQEIRLDGAKDPAELHAKDPAMFVEKFGAALEAAQPLGDDTPPPSALRCSADVAMLPVDWLWRWRIPRGMLSMFDGDPGLCKSTVIIDLAARRSRGEPLPGDKESDGPSDTILISFEDTAAHVIAPRLVAAGADRKRVHLWDLDGQPFNIVDSLGTLESEIRRVKAGWAVIDPLMAAFPTGLNAHRDQDVRAALAPLAKLAERTGCAITFVRHLNKSGGGNALYRGGGSIGIIGAARAGMVLGLDPEDGTKGKDGARIIAMTKSNVGRPASALRLRVVQAASPAPRIEVAKIAWEGEASCTADDLVNTEAEREESGEAGTWLKTLLEDGPQPTEEIKSMARKAGLQWRTVERAKKKIGAIAKRDGFGAAGTWKWKLPGYGADTGGQS